MEIIYINLFMELSFTLCRILSLFHLPIFRRCNLSEKFGYSCWVAYNAFQTKMWRYDLDKFGAKLIVRAEKNCHSERK